MAGLLGDGWSDPQSNAIMQLAGGLLSGNFGAGAAAYGNAMSQGQDQALKRQMLKMQMEEAQSKAKQEQDMRALAGRFATPAQPGMAAIQGDPTTGILPSEGRAAVPAGFDKSGYAQALYGIDPLKAIAFESATAKDDAAVTLKPGEQLFSGKASGYKPLLSVPDKVSLPAAVQEYQFAKGQGYGGTFEQWDTARKRAGASSVSVNTGQKGLDNTLKLRGDFRSEPIYKAHQEVQSAHSQITQALKQASPAGDLAGATKLMKILDPGSVVRESELGMAMAASGALDRIQNYATNVMNGTKLTPTQRKDFQTLADSLYQESGKQYNTKRGEYQGIAERNGLSVPDVLGAEVKSQDKPKTSGQMATLPAANPSNKGRKIRDTQTGKILMSNGMSWVEAK